MEQKVPRIQTERTRKLTIEDGSRTKDVGQLFSQGKEQTMTKVEIALEAAIEEIKLKI